MLKLEDLIFVKKQILCSDEPELIFGIWGSDKAGKSLLINKLLDIDITKESEHLVPMGFTSTSYFFTLVKYGESFRAFIKYENGDEKTIYDKKKWQKVASYQKAQNEVNKIIYAEIEYNHPLLLICRFIDTPGWGSAEDEIQKNWEKYVNKIPEFVSKNSPDINLINLVIHQEGEDYAFFCQNVEEIKIGVNKEVIFAINYEKSERKDEFVRLTREQILKDFNCSKKDIVKFSHTNVNDVLKIILEKCSAFYLDKIRRILNKVKNEIDTLGEVFTLWFLLKGMEMLKGGENENITS